MNDDFFQNEQEAMLVTMATHSSPTELWPNGCYGSRLAWLTFVGPSPGGGKINPEAIPRSQHVESLFWNNDYIEPCEYWSIGFRNSTQVLVETILNRSKEHGALKLYNFTNFDWIQNPDASNVPLERMKEGVEVVLEHLNSVKPRVILTMEQRSHDLLTKTISKQYEIRCPKFDQIRVLSVNTRDGQRYHRHIDAYSIYGHRPLVGRFVIRCPQHPARIFNKDYAARIARVIRKVLISMATNNEPISINEL